MICEKSANAETRPWKTKPPFVNVRPGATPFVWREPESIPPRTAEQSARYEERLAEPNGFDPEVGTAILEAGRLADIALALDCAFAGYAARVDGNRVICSDWDGSSDAFELWCGDDGAVHIRTLNGKLYEAASMRDFVQTVIAAHVYGKPAPPEDLPSVIVESPVAPTAPKAANDNAPTCAIPRVVNPAEWNTRSVPTRDWFVEGLIPARTVTLLYGDGGVGKSLLALQLGVAMSLGIETVGMAPKPGRCLYLGAEDDEDEFHRRIADILRSNGHSLSDLGNFSLLPMADQDAVLALPDRSGKMEATQAFAELVEIIGDIEPALLVLDTLADVFGGDEIKRTQARQFIGLLRRIAIRLDCTVLVLAHPSVDGMRTGTGTSGNTGWNNSVRSRLYLDRITADGEETGAIRLRTMKSNYGPRDRAVLMHWQDGAFVADADVSPLVNKATDKRADDKFLALLTEITRHGQRVSPNPSQSYAPKIMADHFDAGGITKKQFTRAMQRLLGEGLIKIVEEGPPSRAYKRLLPASEMHGDAPSNSPSN